MRRVLRYNGPLSLPYVEILASDFFSDILLLLVPLIQTLIYTGTSHPYIPISEWFYSFWFGYSLGDHVYPVGRCLGTSYIHRSNHWAKIGMIHCIFGCITATRSDLDPGSRTILRWRRDGCFDGSPILFYPAIG